MPVEVILPKVDMDMTEGTVAVWHVAEGDTVARGQPLFDIETDKAAMEVESPASGRLCHVSARAGDRVAIGAAVAWIYAEGEAVGPPPGVPVAQAPGGDPVDAPVEEAEGPAPVPPSAPQGRPRATPLARRLAREHGLDLARLAGSGRNGRIQRADIDAALAAPASASAPAPGPDPRVPDPRVIADRLGIGYTEHPVSRMRATIARRLTESKATVPHFYLETDCAMDRLLDLRAALAEAKGARISVNDILIAAAARALRETPEANAAWAGDRIVRYSAAHVSVAVAVTDGLLTPVLRDADAKDIVTIARETRDLAGRARAGRLKPEERQGGCMTVSNLGMYGVRAFGAIINPPESMILAVGRAEKRVVVDEGGAQRVATMMSVTLSCDHRVVDGALGARWLAAFRAAVENPLRLLT